MTHPSDTHGRWNPVAQKFDPAPSLAEFLEARIAERERAARAAAEAAHAESWRVMHEHSGNSADGLLGTVGCGIGQGVVRHLFPAGDTSAEVLAHIADWDPARVLAEAEAKRRIVDDCREILDDEDGHYDFRSRDIAWDHLRLLALPYADHPAFRPEWRL